MAEPNSSIEPSNDSNSEDLTPEQIEAKKKIDDRIALVDTKFGTPEQRATPIMNKLQELLKDESTWDVVCACTQFLGQVAPLYALDKEVNQLGFQVHLVHYFKIELPK